MFTTACDIPREELEYVKFLTSRNVTNPAAAEAKKYFQIADKTGLIPSSIGFPAYQKAGTISTKNEIVHASAIPEGPQCSPKKKSTIVKEASSSPHRSQRSGCPTDR